MVTWVMSTLKKFESDHSRGKQAKKPYQLHKVYSAAAKLEDVPNYKIIGL